MKTNYISQVISHFFKERHTPAMEQEIQKWLVEEKHTELKDSALSGIWKNIKVSPDQSTLYALSEVKNKLGLPFSKNAWNKRVIYPRRLFRVAVIFLPLLLAGTIYLYTKDLPEQQTEIYTARGERKQIILPDASRVWLNANSKLCYTGSFNEKNRTVSLSGEAYFSVRKNTDKPFIVKTDRLTVQALGTEFNVKACAGTTTATLNKGKIKIDITSLTPESYILTPNQQLTCKDGEKAIISEVIADETSAWKKGQLIFRDATLPKIINTLEQHFNVVFLYTPKHYPTDHYSIKFVNGETVEQTLNILKEVTGNFTYTINKDTISLQPIQ